ncbi:NagZ [Desulforapulum autotrophicum HRM2]|uniref:beta-N-acetylhexosaminidase n=1 Tax=Desulforapulum autotrophicum (strain ATCC 43914 / DSM 3382 / VKM B-1955 / HRM2) TaxID=177437 RepID=C0Q8X8_DESAH|nr:glycoside hydrolase family 3 N-terminal domain-containing protein [Desulforapulum autotrophicum]ACN14468.1 NagZ [Desulforapulum autotrophicum HRM2]
MNQKRTTDRERAGQRVVAGFRGTEFNSEIEHLISNLKVGGLILFAINIETPAQVKHLCDRAQACAASQGLPPLFIAIDQEGGVVARLKAPHFKTFPGNPTITTRDQARVFAVSMAEELALVGVNLNLAPVLDVVPDGFDSIMASRALPGGPERVADLGACIIETLQAKGIMACAKHFPGIGRTVLDSHFELPVLHAHGTLLESSDLVPFTRAVEADVATMMLSHILYPALDPVWPASLSPAIADQLLRNMIEFRGVSMTDDLDMKAIKQDISTCITQILKANIDLALICHTGPDIEKAVIEIEQQTGRDERLFEMAGQSLERIARLKERFLPKSFRF